MGQKGKCKQKIIDSLQTEIRKIDIIRNLKVAKNSQKLKNSKITHLNKACFKEDILREISKYLELNTIKYYL